MVAMIVIVVIVVIVVMIIGFVMVVRFFIISVIVRFVIIAMIAMTVNPLRSPSFVTPPLIVDCEFQLASPVKTNPAKFAKTQRLIYNPRTATRF
jgi:hypothetical protein